MTLDRQRIEKPAAAAETTIDLLKGDDVSAELADHPCCAIGSGNAIGAPAFVDVVGRNLHRNLDSDLELYLLASDCKRATRRT